MRHLLALLDGGTHGTRAEPSDGSALAHQKLVSDQILPIAGTQGTLGTLKNQEAATAAPPPGVCRRRGGAWRVCAARICRCAEEATAADSAARESSGRGEPLLRAADWKRHLIS
jgi:hypothetical protein